jgi:hypothetical protein
MTFKKMNFVFLTSPGGEESEVPTSAQNEFSRFISNYQQQHSSPKPTPATLLTYTNTFADPKPNFKNPIKSFPPKFAKYDNNAPKQSSTPSQIRNRPPISESGLKINNYPEQHPTTNQRERQSTTLNMLK